MSPLTTEARRAAKAACLERKPTPGIYAIRCTPSGQLWVGRAPDLTTIWTRLTFTLTRGAHPRPTLQQAWTTHGASAFHFDPLEPIEEDHPGLRDRLLRSRVDHWRDALGALSV